jgi:hypothetical protein
MTAEYDRRIFVKYLGFNLTQNKTAYFCLLLTPISQISTYIIEESIEHLIQTLNPIAINSDMNDMVRHFSAFNLNITLRTFFGVNLEKLSPKIYEKATKISNPKITIEKLFALLFPNISNAIGIEFTDKKRQTF